MLKRDAVAIVLALTGDVGSSATSHGRGSSAPRVVAITAKPVILSQLVLGLRGALRVAGGTRNSSRASETVVVASLPSANDSDPSRRSNGPRAPSVSSSAARK